MLYFTFDAKLNETVSEPNSTYRRNVIAQVAFDPVSTFAKQVCYHRTRINPCERVGIGSSGSDECDHDHLHNRILAELNHENNLKKMTLALRLCFNISFVRTALKTICYIKIILVFSELVSTSLFARLGQIILPLR